MADKATQGQRVLQYMQENGSITQYDALNALAVMRLASRISDLRKQGHRIISEMVPVKNRYGDTCKVKRYMLEE